MVKEGKPCRGRDQELLGGSGLGALGLSEMRRKEQINNRREVGIFSCAKGPS